MHDVHFPPRGHAELAFDSENSKSLDFSHFNLVLDSCKDARKSFDSSCVDVLFLRLLRLPCMLRCTSM
jgi:hypothetical protein